MIAAILYITVFSYYLQGRDIESPVQRKKEKFVPVSIKYLNQ